MELVTKLSTVTRSRDIRKMNAAELVEFVNTRTEVVEAIWRRAYEEATPQAILIGEALIELKRLHGKHGEWIPFIHKNLRIKEDMVQRYIKLARDPRVRKKLKGKADTARLTFRALDAMTKPRHLTKAEALDRAAVDALDTRGDVAYAINILKHARINTPEVFDAFRDQLSALLDADAGLVATQMAALSGACKEEGE